MSDSAGAWRDRSRRIWDLRLPRGRTLRVGDRPVIVGILNCTPDSFSDGGKYRSHEEAVKAGLEMVEAGADWLDVGGESTRPGAEPVPSKVQLERIVPVVRQLRSLTSVAISVDTMSPEVAAVALEAGADIINDVAACRDPGWRDVLPGRDVPVVLVHMLGSPRDMQANPEYAVGVVPEVLEFFLSRIRALSEWGVALSRVIVDPGIGFGKRLQDNLELIRNIDVFRSLNRPVFIGTSRKSFLRRILDPETSAVLADMNRIELATAVCNAMVLLGGADIIRVHNVPYAAVLRKVFMAVIEAGGRYLGRGGG